MVAELLRCGLLVAAVIYSWLVPQMKLSARWVVTLVVLALLAAQVVQLLLREGRLEPNHHGLFTLLAVIHSAAFLTLAHLALTQTKPVSSKAHEHSSGVE